MRREDVQTSASVLPIRPDGSRPAFHVVGANAHYGPADVDWDAIADATHLHLGGPEFMGGEAAAEILAQARERGITTSADVLAPGDMGILEWIAPALPHLDYLLPNDEQAIGFTGEPDLEAACRALVAKGVGCVAATCGADGVLLVDADTASSRFRRSRWTSSTRPAAATRSRPDSFAASRSGATGGDAAELGCATAALVAQGLGTDYGNFDLDAVLEFAERTPRLGAVEQGR